jgi:hypothetical protein
MTKRASSTANVTWTSFNYPSSISGTDVTGTETVAINYGPDRQRVQQNYTGPTGTESTFYIGGLMDIVFRERPKTIDIISMQAWNLSRSTAAPRPASTP